MPIYLDNDLLYSFEYLDSDTTLNCLIDNSVDLCLYLREDFYYIHSQFEELIS